TEGITKYFDKPAAGFLMEKEIEFLSYVAESPKRPYVAIVGGAKITDKLGVIKNLLSKVDYLLLGGGLIFNFLKAKGYEIGSSIFEPEMLNEANLLLAEKKLLLPSDVVVADQITEYAKVQTVLVNQIPIGWSGVDIGAQTITAYTEIIKSAKTIVWAGPLGIFEIEKFANGSQQIAQAVVEATQKGATSVVGGGDTGAMLKKFKLADKISFISTGGGASLEFLEGKDLPGISALKDKD
ncbi:MAG: phosphoglycerate kinase, partial [candidate division WOR-3 bacterium]|nr:phosphoglycerate kinase [candidate division WOR-3 bacterium]